jgi:16S rRNA (cytosine967-C5)-methyltransferase
MVYAVLRRRGLAEWRIDRPLADGVRDARALVIEHLVANAGLSDCGVLFGAGKYGPPPLDSEEVALAERLAGALPGRQPPLWAELNCPPWVLDELSKGAGAPPELSLAPPGARAPLDLRVNTLRTTREAVLESLDRDRIAAQPTPLSPFGIRLPPATRINQHRFYREGLIEIQDEGSQLVALLAGARPGERVIDLCAGAGGKTLALAAAMGDFGRLIAVDPVGERLDELMRRAGRAGVSIVETWRGEAASIETAPPFDQPADLVVIDAPCSGSGTWRRNPEAAWNLTPASLAAYRGTQAMLLDVASTLTRRGGRIAYITCSLFMTENAGQVADFLRRNHEWEKFNIENHNDNISFSSLMGGKDGAISLTPGTTGTDGFFIAGLVRT